MKLKMSDYAKLSEEEKKDALAALVSAACKPVTPSMIRDMEDDIKAYEDKFKMSSVEMKSRLASGQITETFEHCKWLMELKELERLLKLK